MNIELGIYPLFGIAVGAALYGVYRLLLRLRCAPRAGQWYCVVSLVLCLAATFVLPTYIEERPSVSLLTEASSRVAYAAVAVTPADGDPVDSCISESPAAELVTAESSEDMHPLSQGEQKRWSLLLWLLPIGTLLVVLHMLGQLVWMLWMKRRCSFSCADEQSRVYLTELRIPFSFGRNIFLPNGLDSQTRRFVLMHEQSHVHHAHFLWLCLAQLLVAVEWFNPFAWLLLHELKLAQEIEVDADMLHSGVDRKLYQMSLLNVASDSGRWVLLQTAFGSSALRFRILFMNSTTDRRTLRRRLYGSVAAACVAIALLTVAACRLNPREPHSPVDGVWTMDWIRNTHGTAVNYPFRRHVKLVGHDWLLVLSYNTQDGHEISCGFSAEEQTFQNDTIYNRKHQPAHYQILDGGERHLLEWERDSFQNAMVAGPSITEQWSRIERDADIDYVLQHLYDSALQAHGQRIAGVWEEPVLDVDSVPVADVHEYFVFTDELFYQVHYSEHDHDYNYCAGSITSLTLSCPSDTTLVVHGEPGRVRWQDSAHIEVTFASDNHSHTLHRSALPPRLHHALRTAFPN